MVGRERMKALKPSPDGFLYMLDRYRDMTADEWISVGDAWVDGKASAGAGIAFVSYRGDAEKMKRMGVAPAAVIRSIPELLELVRA